MNDISVVSILYSSFLYTILLNKILLNHEDFKKYLRDRGMVNTVFIATSIDGYIAAEDGALDWLLSIPNPPESDYGFSDFMDRVDGLLMGRNTFETVVASENWIYSKKVFVLSNSISSLSEFNSKTKLDDKSELISSKTHGSLKDLLNHLEERGYRNLYIDGGKLIRSFLKENLIDELFITTVPIILGSGIPLFKSINQESYTWFTHISTEVFENGLVKSHYIKK